MKFLYLFVIFSLTKLLSSIFETFHTSFLFWVDSIGGDVALLLELGLRFRLALLFLIFAIVLNRQGTIVICHRV